MVKTHKAKLALISGVAILFAGIPLGVLHAQQPSAAVIASNDLKAAKALTPSHVVSLPGGGKGYIYYINGVKNEVPVPAAGFSPLTASDAQLQEYGFPPRPQNPNELAQWKSDMSHWKRVAAPTLSTIPGIDHRLRRFNTSESANWGGYVNTSSSNQWIAVQGNWTQPTPGSTSCSNADESSWAGLGGWNTGSLIQAGTDMNYGNTPVAWYEYLKPNGGVAEQPISSITVRPGDSMHVYVSYQTSTGQTDFYVADNTTGTSKSVLVTLDSNYYDGSSAEWIDERPTVNNSLVPLLNYGSDPWTNAQTYNTQGVWEPIGNNSYTSVVMQNNTGNYDFLSEPSSLQTSSSFTDYWLACS